MLRGFFEKYIMGSPDENMEDEVDDPATNQHVPPSSNSERTYSIRESVQSVTSTAHSLPTLPRSAARAESILRSTIRKMRGKNKRMPGGATAQSLTDLICLEYGWPREPVKEKVERALKRAVREGRAEVHGEGREQRYVIADGKMEECLEILKGNPLRRRNIIKEISDDLDGMVKFQKKRNITSARNNLQNW